MKKTRAFAAALAALTALSLSACGDTEESSSKSGTVSLATTTTTTAAESSSEAEQTTTTAEAETTTTVSQTQAPEESEAETTTTTVKEEENAADGLAIKYNGVTFKVGDKFADIEKSLGAYSDHFQAAHCTDDGMDEIYVYGGMDVVVFGENITYVMIYDNSIAADTVPETVNGIKVGIKDTDSILGKPTKSDGTQSVYEIDGTYVYITYTDGAVYSAMISAIKENMPEF